MNVLYAGENSLKIYLSSYPFFIAAGFLEGFITRYSIDMPIWLRKFTFNKIDEHYRNQNKKHNDDLEMSYPDLSKFPIYTNSN